MENESAIANVCAQIDRGSLEREVTVHLSTIPGRTAERNQEQYYHIMHGIMLSFMDVRGEDFLNKGTVWYSIV